MFLAGIFSWWYGRGWLARVQMIKGRLAASADFFSIELLASTLFAPFRQISAGNVVGPIGDQIRAFFDRLISRTVGAIVRTCVIIFGLIAMSLQALFGLFVLISWLIIPMLPIVGLIMMVIGWVPQWVI
jgi:hypothetical protein